MLQCSSFTMPIKAFMAGRWPKSISFYSCSFNAYCHICTVSAIGG